MMNYPLDSLRSTLVFSRHLVTTGGVPVGVKCKVTTPKPLECHLPKLPLTTRHSGNRIVPSLGTGFDLISRKYCFVALRFDGMI